MFLHSFFNQKSVVFRRNYLIFYLKKLCNLAIKVVFLSQILDSFSQFQTTYNGYTVFFIVLRYKKCFILVSIYESQRWDIPTFDIGLLAMKKDITLLFIIITNPYQYRKTFISSYTPHYKNKRSVAKISYNFA